LAGIFGFEPFYRQNQPLTSPLKTYDKVRPFNAGTGNEKVGLLKGWIKASSISVSDRKAYKKRVHPLTLLPR
jgi:hypothetical protein